jgi:hypothetical protein
VITSNRRTVAPRVGKRQSGAPLIVARPDFQANRAGSGGALRKRERGKEA